MNDTSFSQSSIEKNSSNSQPFSTKKKQQSKASSQNSYFYFLLSVWEIPYTFFKKKTSAIVSPTIAIVCILLICQKRNIELRPLAFFSKNLYLRCLAGME